MLVISMTYMVNKLAGWLTLRDSELSVEPVLGSYLHHRYYFLAGFDLHLLHYYSQLTRFGQAQWTYV